MKTNQYSTDNWRYSFAYINVLLCFLICLQCLKIIFVFDISKIFINLYHYLRNYSINDFVSRVRSRLLTWTSVFCVAVRRSTGEFGCCSIKWTKVTISHVIRVLCASATLMTLYIIIEFKCNPFPSVISYNTYIYCEQISISYWIHHLLCIIWWIWCNSVFAVTWKAVDKLNHNSQPTLWRLSTFVSVPSDLTLSGFLILSKIRVWLEYRMWLFLFCMPSFISILYYLFHSTDELILCIAVWLSWTCLNCLITYSDGDICECLW